MPDATAGTASLLALIEPIVWGLGGLVLLLWLCMPFAVFGTKRLLREQAKLMEALVAEQRRANELLYRLGLEEPAPAEPPGAAESGRREPALGEAPSRVSLVADRGDRV